MNAWYFTFEYPPYFGGGLSTYMKSITETYRNNPDYTLVIFNILPTQSGFYKSDWIEENVLLININPHHSREAEELGYWVAVSRCFEMFSDLIMSQIDSGSLSIPLPDYLEFADGFGIGNLTIQKKLCLDSRFENIPIVVLAHTPTYFIDRLNQTPIYKLPKYWIGQMELQSLIGCDAVISPSQAILDEIEIDLSKKKISLSDTKVIPNPYQSTRKEVTISNKRDHFYMASRLTHWKGVENAIEAFKILWNEGCKIPFHIYGTDTFFNVSGTNYKDYLKNKYQAEIRQGLIKFKGICPREQIDKETETAFAQVHPSHFDNFPYSLLESLNQGQICIAGKRGGIKEITTDKENIFIVDVTDKKEFSLCLRTVIDLSDEERQRISKAAQEAIDNHCNYTKYFEEKNAYISALKAKKVSRKTYPFLSKSTYHNDNHHKPENESLSVIIPYYNMGDFIDETITSILDSSYSNIEIVIVNDGSVDPHSVSKLSKLHNQHHLDEQQLKIIHIENSGVATARNVGAQSSTGEFITLLDADDLVKSQYYEKGIKILKEYNNVSFVGCWIEDFNEKGRIRDWATWNAEPPLQLIMNQTNCQSLIYRRDVFLKDGLHDPDLRMFLDDWEGVIALIAAGHRGVMIPEALFQYRIRSNSIFRSKASLWNLNYEKITQKHYKIYNEWGADIAAFFNANGPNNFYHIAGKPSALIK